MTGYGQHPVALTCSSWNLQAGHVHATLAQGCGVRLPRRPSSRQVEPGVGTTSGWSTPSPLPEGGHLLEGRLGGTAGRAGHSLRASSRLAQSFSALRTQPRTPLSHKSPLTGAKKSEYNSN